MSGQKRIILAEETREKETGAEVTECIKNDALEVTGRESQAKGATD
jgi:hypothetical protein